MDSLWLFAMLHLKKALKGQTFDQREFIIKIQDVSTLEFITGFKDLFNKIYSDTCKRSFGATQVCRIAFRVWILMQISCREKEVAVWLNANMRFSGQWADAAENKGSPDPNLGILHWRFSLLGDWTTILTVWHLSPVLLSSVPLSTNLRVMRIKTYFVVFWTLYFVFKMLYVVFYGVFCLWDYKIHHKIPHSAS